MIEPRGGDKRITEISTGGIVCIAVGFFVMYMGLFVSMNTLVGLFLVFGGLLTMIQGGRMKVGEQT